MHSRALPTGCQARSRPKSTHDYPPEFESYSPDTVGQTQ
jgi:hypothetical protein